VYEKIRDLIVSISHVHREGEIDCATCDERFHCWADLAARGEDLREILPEVVAHLEACPECREEFDAILAIIRAEQAGLLDDA
jgi:predicted anti-sigma-YlaC factor YlaD